MSGTRLRRSLVIGLAALLGSCATSRLVNQWRAPDYHGGGFRKILVIGIGDEESNRRTFEDDLARTLEGRGMEAIPGYRFLPKTTEAADEPTLLAAVRDSGADGVLMTRLVGVRDEVHYTPGYVETIARPGFYGYYRSAWSYYRPPRVDRYQIAVLETNLWDAQSQTLVWSGTTETFDPGEIRREVAELSKLIVDALAEGGLIGPPRQ